jgi:hypothetical protein
MAAPQRAGVEQVFLSLIEHLRTTLGAPARRALASSTISSQARLVPVLRAAKTSTPTADIATGPAGVEGEEGDAKSGGLVFERT